MVTLIILCMYVSVIRICLLQNEVAVEWDQNIIFCPIKVLFWGYRFFLSHWSLSRPGRKRECSVGGGGGGVLSQYNDM